MGATTSFRDADELPALESYVRERRCVLFVGAGLSRDAGYPDWHGLMKQVVARTHDALGDAVPQAELAALVAEGKFAEVADECRTLLGRTRFGNELRALLARPDAMPPEATHRAIVRTPWSCIVTTNFDTLLEDAYATWSDVGIPKAPTGVELAHHGTLLLDDAFFILKAHGTIHDPESMVFTSEDYRRITHANPAFQAVMSALMLTRAVLFVGYSLSDPNFRLLMDSQLATFGTEAPPRYALMEDVGDAEKAILRRTAGIEVISYPKGLHGEVAGLLRHLADATAQRRPARRSPRTDALRGGRPIPAATLRLRTNDLWLDSSWFVTTTADPAGFGVPLHETFAGRPGMLDWSALEDVMNVACDNTPQDGQDPADACRVAGEELARAVSDFPRWLRERPPGSAVLLDLPAELWPLPWEWMPVDGQPMCLRHPVCRRTLGLPESARGRPFVRDPLRVLLIAEDGAGVGVDLAQALEEVEEIRRLFDDALPGSEVTPLVGPDATYAQVLKNMRDGRGYDVVHYAGPSGVVGGGTWLQLHDGKVGASELVTLLVERPPALMVLNGCDTGFVPVFTAAFPLRVGREMSFEDHYRRLRRQRVGFERAAARAGVGTFVGVMGRVQDPPAKALMLAFYTALLQGRPAAQALHAARPAGQAARVAAGDASALQHAMAGYADLRLVPPSRR